MWTSPANIIANAAAIAAHPFLRGFIEECTAREVLGLAMGLDPVVAAASAAEEEARRNLDYHERGGVGLIYVGQHPKRVGRIDPRLVPSLARPDLPRTADSYYAGESQHAIPTVRLDPILAEGILDGWEHKRERLVRVLRASQAHVSRCCRAWEMTDEGKAHASNVGRALRRTT